MRSAFLTLPSVAFAASFLWASQVPTLPQKAEQVPRNSAGQESRVGALYFDPLGADFTAWLNQFKDETYRHWVLPEAVSKGAQGCTQIRFTVSRGGRIASLRIAQPSGKKPLDRAVETALRSSSLLPLPPDYPAQSLAVEVAFFYNSEPSQQPRLCTSAQRPKEQQDDRGHR